MSHARSSLWMSCALPGQSEENELRTASEPCCAGSGDGAGGSAVVGLDPDAGLINALLPLCPAHPLPAESRQQLVAVLAVE